MSGDYSAERPIRIGTRASPLALMQAYETRDRLIAAHGLPGEALEIVRITTTGDMRQEKKLGELGGKGLFTKEIEEALYANTIDIAVHSMKDMPTALPGGLEISTILPSADVRDVFVSLKYESIDAMPSGAVMGTASLRRQAQLLHRRPDLHVGLFRGNVQTRLRKLDEGQADATFLAKAGLDRMGTPEVATYVIPPDEMLPAVAQGAIGIEIRSDDAAIRAALLPLNCTITATRLAAERAFLAALDGSCRTPIAGLAEIDGDRLRFRGEVFRPDGTGRLQTGRDGPVSDATAMGRDAGEELLAQAGPDYFAEH